jgi:hypothetical protein
MVRGMSEEPGTNPEYPRPQHMSLFWLSGPQPEAQHYLDQIADQRSREDEALQGHKRQSLWKRFLGRRGHVTP